MKKLTFALLVVLLALACNKPDTGNYFNVYYEYNIIGSDTLLVDVIYHATNKDKWHNFQECIKNMPTDAVCDSCYDAIFN